MNKVVLIGRLGKDANTKLTPKGTVVSRLRVATNEKRGEEKVVMWHNVVMFNRAKLAQYCYKGRLMFIEGRLTYSSNNIPYILAEKVRFLDSPKEPKEKALSDLPDILPEEITEPF